MEEHYLKGKIRIFYKKNKFEKNRKTLVFIHGISGSSAAWIPYEQEFEKNYNVLSYDLRGHGKSFKPKSYEDYTMKKFVEDLVLLLKHEKINRFVLICHSFAAMIAMEFLKKHQKMVEKAIFLSPIYTAPRGKLACLIKSILKVTKPIWPNVPNKTGGHVNYNHYKNTGDWNIPRMIQDIGNTGLGAFLDCTLQSYNFDAKDFLKDIKIPTLLIHGKKDSIFDYGNSVYMQKNIKNSKLISIPYADHILVLNNFKEVSREIYRFL